MKFDPTEEQETIHRRIREVYNSGRCGEALRMAVEFHDRHPECVLAKYDFSVMHGDYAVDPVHSQEESRRLLETAKKGFKELIDDPDRAGWPERFSARVRNEYCWFFELPQAQYELGLELNQANAGSGDYPACVGASMMALKSLRCKDPMAAGIWAETALTHFRDFEKQAPDWYNINYFAAQALACLGRYKEALAAFKDMFRKQKAEERADQVDEFIKLMDEIRGLRPD
jgi:hypothetical protein